MAAKRYEFERGNYGIFPGTIMPFCRTLSGDDPSSPEWKEPLPAGYLRCDGSVVSAVDYPNLKDLFGVGANSKFKKDNVTLDEEINPVTGVANQSGGQIQLPDLGSKMIRAGTRSGGYDSTTVIDPDTGIEYPKVGAAATTRLNFGETVEMRYTGNLVFARTPINFLNVQNFSTNMGNVIDSIPVTAQSYLAHGHYSTLPVYSYANYGQENCYTGNMQTGNTEANPDPDIIETPVGSYLTQYRNRIASPVGGLDAGTEHLHTMDREPPEFAPNTLQSFIPDTELQAFNIVTEVNLRDQSGFKMDDIQPKFILVEFLLKF